jgi:hypothetical protein
MRGPDAQPGTEPNGRSLATTPLFRPEALEVHTRNLYGEILLVRPLSLALLCWVGAGLAAIAAAIVVWGSYTETGHVTGTLRLQESRPEVRFEVPARWKDYLHEGQSVSLRCRSCTDPYFNHSTGIVTSISPRPADIPISETFSASISTGREPLWTVTVSLSGNHNSPLRAGARIEAALPLARHRLFHWIFGRAAA